MSSSLNSLKGDFIGDYIGDYYRDYQGGYSDLIIAHIHGRFCWYPLTASSFCSRNTQ